jgi:hypothetical protein
VEQQYDDDNVSDSYVTMVVIVMSMLVKLRMMTVHCITCLMQGVNEVAGDEIAAAVSGGGGVFFSPVFFLRRVGVISSVEISGVAIMLCIAAFGGG